jgi:hypothetical protein
LKVDEDCIFNGPSINNLFENVYPSNTNQRFITCDAAGLGIDLCTIWVWYGWKVVKLAILKTSEPQEIVDAIEAERERYSIPKGRVIVDQDGIGGKTVKLGRYKGFSGGDAPFEDPSIHKRENYKNLKTQLYYRYADRVNNDEVSMPLSNENVSVDGVHTIKIKLKGKLYDIRDLIKSDLRAIKRKDRDSEGKKQINSKAEQKVLLRGRSPDFGDGSSLREYFEFKSGELKTGNPTKSILDLI